MSSCDVLMNQYTVSLNFTLIRFDKGFDVYAPDTIDLHKNFNINLVFTFILLIFQYVCNYSSCGYTFS